jgi:hypothetical protein
VLSSPALAGAPACIGSVIECAPIRIAESLESLIDLREAYICARRGILVRME